MDFIMPVFALSLSMALEIHRVIMSAYYDALHMLFSHTLVFVCCIMTVIHPKRRPTDPPVLNIKYICDACHGDISQTIRIRCAECPEAVDSCVECFSEGAEIKPHHLATHAYQVMEPFSFPIYDEEWRADEEVLLIDGAISVGLGNWMDIANYIGTKTAEECERHYMSLYVESTEFPNPRPEVFRRDFAKKPVLLPLDRMDMDEVKRKFVEPEYNVLVSQPSTHDIAGYMPLRDEFETELDQEAELVIRDLNFGADESVNSLDFSFKVALLQGYNDTLDRRWERKRFIHDHEFLDFKKYLALEKQRSKEEKQLLSKLSIYQRFMSAKDFEVFQKGFLEETKLIQMIARLQEYRKQGIRDFETAATYERELTQGGHSMDGGLSASMLGSIPDGMTYNVKSNSTTVVPLYPKGLQVPASAPISPSATAAAAAIAPMVRRSLGQPLDISDAEGIELLSSSERNICSILRVMPRVYLCIKETFIAAYHKNGYLKRAQARSLVKIDVNKTSKLYDFFVSSGWIRPRIVPETSVQKDQGIAENE
jgi:transcriptional adapter 2-alpha